MLRERTCPYGQGLMKCHSSLHPSGRQAGLAVRHSQTPASITWVCIPALQSRTLERDCHLESWFVYQKMEKTTFNWPGCWRMKGEGGCQEPHIDPSTQYMCKQSPHAPIQPLKVGAGRRPMCPLSPWVTWASHWTTLASAASFVK